ncbi:histidine kinase dimerization/phosphoacceptor domain -containing protein [Hymenobacter daeguensis]
MANPRTFFVFLAALLGLALPARAQPVAPPLPSNAQMDSVRHRLRTSVADTNRVSQLLLLGQFYLARFRGDAVKADTVLRLVQQAQTLSRALHYPRGEGIGYLVGARAWLQKEDVPRERAAARQAIDLFTRLGDARHTAEAYWELSLGFAYRMEEQPERLRCYEQCLVGYRKSGDVPAQISILVHRSTIYMLLAKDDAALSDLLAALQLARTADHALRIAIYNKLSTLYVRRDDYKNGLHYGLLGIKTAESAGDTSIVAAMAYNQVGIVYRRLKDNDKALPYFRKALALVQRKPYDGDVVTVFSNTVSSLEQGGQPAAALRLLTRFVQQHPPLDDEMRSLLTAVQLLGLHTTLKQYAQAQQHYNQVQALTNTLQAGSPQFDFVYGKAIAFLLATRQYGEARATLARQESYYRYQRNDLFNKGQNQLNWFRLDSALGNYHAAIRHYQHYVTLRDSLFTQAKAKEISRLDIQYQSQRKDREIKLQKQNIQLLNKQRLLQQKQLERGQQLRNALLAGAVLLVLVLGLGYNRYRLKQRSNQLLEAQQAAINAQNHSLAQLLAEKGILLEEKNWMLKEIHHRVKNNLEVISSLLNLQSDFLPDPVVQGALRESQNRVHAMALLHQKLYQSDSLARVNMQEYVQDIVAHLIDSFDRQASVRPHLTVEAIELDVAIATPLGLILNEAVTNSLKYAFPHQQPGVITVSLACTAPQRYQLTIADNGVGMAESFYVEHVRTLGITMIKGLSQQLDADLTIAQDSGVQITLQFEAASKPADVAAATV